MGDLVILRHAPSVHGGRLAGRRDVEAEPFDPAPVRARLARFAHLPRRASPARRCMQTARALWDEAPPTDPRLWEQDMGEWEGTPFADLPDLGPLAPADLAAHRPPGGESFEDMRARVEPALRDAAPAVIIAHAGTARAALALAVGPAALSFEIAPLSVTHVRLMEGGVSVACVGA